MGLRRVWFYGLAALCFVSSRRRSVPVADRQGCWAAAGSEAPTAISGREAEAEQAQARGQGFSGWEAEAAIDFVIICIAQTHSGLLCLVAIIFVGRFLRWVFLVDIYCFVKIELLNVYVSYVNCSRISFLNYFCLSAGFACLCLMTQYVSRMSVFIIWWHNMFQGFVATPDRDSVRF